MRRIINFKIDQSFKLGVDGVGGTESSFGTFYWIGCVVENECSAGSVVSHVQKDTTPRRAPCVNMMALQGIFNTS